jgi:hypothetical protein
VCVCTKHEPSVTPKFNMYGSTALQNRAVYSFSILLLMKLCLVDASHKLSICQSATGQVEQGSGVAEQCFEASEFLNTTHTMFMSIRSDAKHFVNNFSSVHESVLSKVPATLIGSILTKIAADLSQDV